MTLPLETALRLHLRALSLNGYSDYTVRNRRVHIRFFIRWCLQQRITDIESVTPEALQGYRNAVFEHRQRNGRPLTMISQHARLVPLRVWFRWALRHDLIQSNPAEQLELPRLGRALPRTILSVREAERVLMQPNTGTSVGLRDRAILELMYTTGIRRLECVHLTLSDCHFDRRLLFVKQGKGNRDRYVPASQRALDWIRKYLREARPRLTGSHSESDALFVSRYGWALSRDHLTYIARKYVEAAKLGKSGACHLFRHTMATLMHENGADIRHVQQMLGHADIKTTQIYTQVAIRTLQRVHAATHPAA